MQTALLPHLILKDLRHVRLLFGLWLFLLLAQGTLIGSGFNAGPGQMLWQVVYTILAMGIPMLQGLVIVILLPILIQDESLVGTTAFWFTRPISRGTLLAAKTVFVASFLVIPPLVVEVLVFAANGIEMRDILRALPQVLYGSIALIVPVAALSTLTRSFAKFALWAVVLWVALATFAVVVQFGRMLLSMDTFLADSQNMSLAMSRGIAGGLCMIAGGAAVIANQYLTRRMRVSLFILLGTAISTAAVQTLWKYDFLKRPEPAVSQTTFPAGTVAVRLNPKSVSANDALQFSPWAHDPRTDIRARLLFSDVPAGYQAELSDVDSEMTFADGTRIHSNKFAILPTPQHQWWASALSHAIGDVPVSNSTSDSDGIYGQVFSLDSTVFQRRKSEPGTLRSKLSLKVSKLTAIGHLPIREGARLDDGSRHIEIAAILKQPEGYRLILRERKVNLWSSGKFPQFNPLAEKSGVYLLVNRARNEAILPDQSFDFDMASTLLQTTARLINRSFLLDFSGTRNDTRVVAVDEDWLAGAELVFVEAKPAGVLERELTATNFLLNPKK